MVQQDPQEAQGPQVNMVQQARLEARVEPVIEGQQDLQEALAQQVNMVRQAPQVQPDR